MESLNKKEARLAHEAKYFIDLTKKSDFENQSLDEQKRMLVNALTVVREYLHVLRQQSMIDKAMR